MRPNLLIYYFESEVSGKIIAPRGSNGFGWDSIFSPDGYSCSFAELSFYQKNIIVLYMDKAIIILPDKLCIDNLVSSLQENFDLMDDDDIGHGQLICHSKMVCSVVPWV